MLQSISDSIRNSKWLGWVIVSIIAVPFALWGIGSYLGVGEDPYVAKVNGVEISARDYERAYYQRRNALARQFGGRLPPALIEAGFIKAQTVESLVTQQLLLQTVSGAGYRVADGSLRDSIVDNPAFQVDGGFSKDAYERQLRSLGVAPQQYEENMRQALALEQMRSGVIATSFYTKQEQADIAKLRAQTRSASALVFPVSDFITDEAVSDAQLDEYFKANATRFFRPEAVKLGYLELNQAALARGIDIDDEALRKLYEERQSAFTTPEKRFARHILIKADSEAGEQALAGKRREIESLRGRILAGESFEALAREHSQDPGSARQGGDLGEVQRGVMVKPFEDAVFALQLDEVSDVVETPFGLHLIQLYRLDEGSVQPFDEAKKQLREQEQLRAAENLFYDRVDVIANEAYENSDSLASASEAAGIALAQSEWIDRNGGPGIGEYAPVRSAAFSDTVLGQRLNSEMIEVGNNHVVVIRVNEHRERSAKALDEVRDEVRQAIVQQRAKDAAAAAAEQALEALRGGESPAEVATRFGGRLETHEAVTREDANLEEGLRRALFRLPYPEDGRPTFTSLTNATGDPVLLALDEVRSAGLETSEEPPTAPPGSPGSNEYNAWLEALKSVAEIERREENL